MKKKSVIFLGIITLLAFTLLAPNTNIVKKAYANDGATIAGISVGSLKENEIRTTLSDAIATWSQNPPTIQGGGSSLTIDPASFNFDIEATLSVYKSLTDKPWYAFWESNDSVHIPLEVTGTEVIKDRIESIGSWNVDETYALAIQNIANLKTEPIEAVVIDTTVLEAERLAFIIQDIPEKAKAVYDMAVYLDGTVIGAGEKFSLLSKLNSLADNSNVEGLSFVGSLLYRNALYTNTIITERHAQQVIPTYLEPGFEAYINVKTAKDLSFTNNSKEPIKMRFTVTGQKLKIEFLSSAITNSVTVQATQEGEVEPRRIVRFTDDLPIGSQRILQKGEKGARVAIFRTVDGFEEQISRDYYPPTNEILIKSSRQPEASSSTHGTATGSDDKAQDGSTSNDNSNNGDDVLDLDNDGLPDINQGEGYNQKVDKEGNVIQPEGTTTDKSGNTVSKKGSSS